MKSRIKSPTLRNYSNHPFPSLTLRSSSGKRSSPHPTFLCTRHLSEALLLYLTVNEKENCHLKVLCNSLLTLAFGFCCSCGIKLCKASNPFFMLHLRFCSAWIWPLRRSRDPLGDKGDESKSKESGDSLGIAVENELCGKFIIYQRKIR